MAPTISVVMPFHNRARFLDAALGSVLRQTRAPDEIIVVNDGSRPEEAAGLEPWADRCTIIHQENRGVSGACNAGIVAASGEWIAFLDDDDYWVDHRLATMMRYIDAHPDCVAVHNAVQVIGTDRIHRKAEMGLQDFLHVHPNPALRSSTMIKRHALVSAGLMNPTLSMDEDYDCFLRVALHHRFHYVDEVLTQRGHNDDRLSLNISAECEAANRVLHFYRTLYPSPADYRAYALRMNTVLAARCVYGKRWETFGKMFGWTAEHGVSRLRLGMGVAGELIRNRMKK